MRFLRSMLTVLRNRRNQADAPNASRESWADAAAWMENKAPYTHGFHDFYCQPNLRQIQELHVTLIHGTFAREAAWVGTDSPLAKQLVREGEDGGVKVFIHTYRWTGGLSFRAR